LLLPYAKAITVPHLAHPADIAAENGGKRRAVPLHPWETGGVGRIPLPPGTGKTERETAPLVTAFTFADSGRDRSILEHYAV